MLALRAGRSGLPRLAGLAGPWAVLWAAAAAGGLGTGGLSQAPFTKRGLAPLAPFTKRGLASAPAQPSAPCPEHRKLAISPFTKRPRFLFRADNKQWGGRLLNAFWRVPRCPVPRAPGGGAGRGQAAFSKRGQRGQAAFSKRGWAGPGRWPGRV